MARAGSDIVELGIPFSDPLADGPAIQRSSQRALRRGYGLADYIDGIKEIRKRTDIPLVLFSYYNPIFQYGMEMMASEARAAGVDGILVTDMIPEEAGDYCACLERNDLDSIFLVAPTSSLERVNKIANCSRGFVYLISRTGVTGIRESLSNTLLATLEKVRRFSSLPVAVGFGISSPEQVKAVWQIAEGAVVGSAIVVQMEQKIGASDLVAHVGDFCSRLTGRQRQTP
jgi:tryptophan synthase alpha chain